MILIAGGWQFSLIRSLWKVLSDIISIILYFWYEWTDAVDDGLLDLDVLAWLMRKKILVSSSASLMSSTRKPLFGLSIGNFVIIYLYCYRIIFLDFNVIYCIEASYFNYDYAFKRQTIFFTYFG